MSPAVTGTAPGSVRVESFTERPGLETQLANRKTVPVIAGTAREARATLAAGAPRGQRGARKLCRVLWHSATRGKLLRVELL